MAEPVRREVVCYARALISDPEYPSPELLGNVASILVTRLVSRA